MSFVNLDVKFFLSSTNHDFHEKKRFSKLFILAIKESLLYNTNCSKQKEELRVVMYILNEIDEIDSDCILRLFFIFDESSRIPNGF